MKPSPRAYKLTEFLAVLVFALFVLGAAACSKAQEKTEADLGVLQALSLAFDSVPVGSSKLITATITNSGEEAATDIKVEELNAPFSLEKSTCGTSLASKASCELKVAFAPTEVHAYEIKVSLSFFTGKKQSAISVVLNASSVLPASLTLSGVDDYGPVAIANDVSQVLTVTNSGQYQASGLLFLGFSEPYHLSARTCGSTLEAGASCTITILFRPTDGIPASQNIYVDYKSGAASETAVYGLTGQGQTRALLAITGDADFGNTATNVTTTHTFVLSNDGQWDATAITLVAGPTDAFSLGATNCTDYLPPGASCHFDVTFAPADIAPASSSIEYSYEDGVFTGLSTSLAFTGNGISPR